METTMMLSNGKLLKARRDNRRIQVRLNLITPNLSTVQLREFCRDATNIRGVLRAEKHNSRQIVVTLAAGPESPDQSIRPILDSLKRTLESTIERSSSELSRSRSHRRKRL